MRTQLFQIIAAVSLCALPHIVSAQSGYKAPHNTDGTPDLQGIWQVRNTSAALDLQKKGIIVDPADGKIPYQPAALAKREQNFKNRQAEDTLNKCFMPGVPRITYLNYPFQIFQTPKYTIIAYQYIHNYRTIYTNNSPHIDGLDFWLGDSRGHYDGDSLVVDVSDFNDRTWFDAAGDYHTGKLHVTERYTRTGPDSMQYEATIEDPDVFTRPWKIRLPLYRRKEANFRILEYECQPFAEESSQGSR
jgi:hypothetical protein